MIDALNAIIRKAGATTFAVECPSLGIAVSSAKDPEHALCRALVAAGVPDGPIAFRWMSGGPGMRGQSIHEIAGWSVGEADFGIGFHRHRYVPRPDVESAND